MELQVPKEYGYVILSGLGAIVGMQYLGGLVMKGRKVHDVPYPTMTDDDKPIFNCIQRGHQNALETYPQAMLVLFLGGIRHPIISSIAGVAWTIGRIMYARGYSTGDPKARHSGALFRYPALLALLGCTVSTALGLLEIV